MIFIEKIVKGYKYSVFGWTPAPEYSLNKHYTIYRWYTKDLKLPIAEAYLNEEDFVEYITYQYDSPLGLILPVNMSDAKVVQMVRFK